MKKLRIVILAIVALMAMSACDKIDPPYIEADNNTVDTTECPIPTFPVVTAHTKTILVEEYTGHSCVNCPTAANILHGMETTYGDKIVIVAIHAGFFAEPATGCYSQDLRCSTGNDLHANFGITDNPAAMFNRKTIGSTNIFTSAAAWETVFQSADTTPVLDMQIINIYNESENKVCIHIQTEYLVDMVCPLNLAVYATEDSITGCQKNNNASMGPVPDITDYVFMHVLRAPVNGTWGSVLSDSLVAAGTKKISSYKLVLNSQWNPGHCHIVALVYNNFTGEVLQSAQQKVTP